MKGQSRLDVRKYFVSHQRTANEWNNLSPDCVHSSGVNMFKTRIDNYLVRAGYTYSHRPTCGLLISQWLPCL